MPSKLTLSKETLMDKIKGGWAGQVIGCTYGGPTEFRWRAKMIPDSENIPWGEPDYIEQMMKRQPGLYDDIYMDLTFVESFERLGIDAPVDSIALAFAHAKYPLWQFVVNWFILVFGVYAFAKPFITDHQMIIVAAVASFVCALVFVVLGFSSLKQDKNKKKKIAESK